MTVTGLADLIATTKSDSIVAVVDASKANPGPDVQLNVVAKSLVSGVNPVQNPPPFVVNIDRLSVSTLTVQVVDHAAADWEVTKADALCPTTPCVVHFTGPASWEVNLKAVAVFPNPISNSTYDVLTWPVSLQQGNTTPGPQ